MGKGRGLLRGWGRAAAAVAAVVVLGAGTATWAPALAAPGAATPGAAGAGDPYFPLYGNGGYDVSHYDIAVDYRPATGRLQGRTTITATATQALSRFDLDLVLPVSSVTVNGRRAAFSHRVLHELVVTPAAPLAKGARFAVTVVYAGTPATISDHGSSPWAHRGDEAAAVGEPEISAWWFPADDHPSDAASYTIAVTVPHGLQALSNGRLLRTHGAASGDTWTWQESAPMASYLAFMAVGHYTVSRGTSNGVPWVTAVSKGLNAQLAAAARADLARTPEIVAWHAQQWGRYPFDAMGGVVPAVPMNFALEDQTRPVYGPVFWAGGRSQVTVLVHELAHQWFGDAVRLGRWRDVWLNEGFATYTEWRWAQTHGGATTAATLASRYAAHPQGDPFWSVRPADPGAAKLFSRSVYERGAMTLAALENVVGTDTLNRILRDWVSGRQGRTAATADFIALAERDAGRDLHPFFTAWLSTAARPAATAANGLG
jgi:aminopeptidase N